MPAVLDALARLIRDDYVSTVGVDLFELQVHPLADGKRNPAGATSATPFKEATDRSGTGGVGGDVSNNAPDTDDGDKD